MSSPNLAAPKNKSRQMRLSPLSCISLAIGVDAWEELPLAETIVPTTNNEKEKATRAMLDAPKPVAVKPGKRGRKKKVLEASKDDREITSFFSKTVKPWEEPATWRMTWGKWMRK
jgi:hypothetical protein